MIPDEQQAQELIIRNEYLDNLIYKLDKQKRELEKEKLKNKNKLKVLCKHNRERQREYEYHNEKIYQCSKCKLIS